MWMPPRPLGLKETWGEWYEGWKLWIQQVGMNLWYGRGGLNVKVRSLFHSVRETKRKAASPKIVERRFAISVTSTCHLRELKQRILNSHRVLEKSHTSLRVSKEASRENVRKHAMSARFHSRVPRTVLTMDEASHSHFSRRRCLYGCGCTAPTELFPLQRSQTTNPFCMELGFKQSLLTHLSQRYYIWKQRQAEAQANIWTDAQGYYFLNIMVVSPTQQGKGIGKKLARAVTKMADAEGRRCYLESSRSEPNMKIYEAMGFHFVKQMDCDDGGDICKLYCMVREAREPEPQPPKLPGGALEELPPG
jgi:hypothetical protein